MSIKLFYAKKLTDNWAFEVEVLKWSGSPGWFPIYENNLSAKIRGSHRGFYWSYYILGLKIIEFNLYDTRHDDEYENSDLKKKE
ncbi:MAG: hypothetical protein VW270_00010 [Candidatus Poseidoniales archaeon]